MYIEECNSISFYDNDLHQIKKDRILRKAVNINIFKNLLSIHISKNINEYIYYSKNDLVIKFGNQTNTLHQSSSLRGGDYQKAVIDVYTAYQNKAEQIIHKLTFRIQKTIKYTYYKKTKKVKTIEVKHKTTDLCKVINYLSRYGYYGIYNDLPEKILLSTSDKTELFYEQILCYMKKFGEKRLLDLAFSKRDRLFNQYNKKPICFTSLSFRGGIQTKEPLLQKAQVKEGHHRTNSKIVAVLPAFNGKGTDDLTIPLKYANKYHGNIKDYTSKEYTICIEGDKIRLITTKVVEKEYKTDNDKYVGVDVNIKHNMFSSSLGINVDYDRDLLNKFSAFLVKTDKKELTDGENKQKDVYRRRIIHMLKQKCRDMVNVTLKNNQNHIIMEDLGLFGKTFSRNSELNGLKYSRLTRELHLGSLNDYMASICQKNGIQLTIIPAHYTSQLCLCGCIDKRNRITQEIFKCINCSTTDNADYHSSNTIKFIGSNNVLSELLLEQNTSSWKIPKKYLKKEYIRKSLEDYIIHNHFNDYQI